MRRDGFTLVELLVVVAIIVVLLALLTPALDQAVYQAELAVCGARLKSLGTAATVYTVDHKRHYPYRRVIERVSGQPTRLAVANPVNDDRRLLEGYMSYENYLDPFLPRTDIAGSHPNTHVFANYSLWYGFRFKEAGHKGMRKVGDRVEWLPQFDTGEPLYRFSLLASDPDHVRSGNDWAFTSTPDALGILAPVSLQDTDLGGVQMEQAGVLKQTLAWWQKQGDARVRGPLDLNYAYEDGSVLRLNDVRWNEFEDRDRTVRTAEHSGLTTEQTDWHQLPRPR